MEPGELLGLLGPNGAGKLTLTKIACVGWCGRAPATPRSMALPPAPGGAAVGYLAELFRFPEWLSADELIALHQSLAGSDGGPRERGELPDLVGLAEARRTKVDAMSKSMQQPLGIAQALVGRPRLVMLDEPASARSCFVRDAALARLRERDRAAVSLPHGSERLVAWAGHARLGQTESADYSVWLTIAVREARAPEANFPWVECKPVEAPSDTIEVALSSFRALL